MLPDRDREGRRERERREREERKVSERVYHPVTSEREERMGGKRHYKGRRE